MTPAAKIRKERALSALDRIVAAAPTRARDAAEIAEALRNARAFAHAVNTRHGKHPLTRYCATGVIEEIDAVLGVAR